MAEHAAGSGYSKDDFFLDASRQTSFGLSNETPNNAMEDKGKNEQLIDKLIRKRKEENDAFIKLLHAIETKVTENQENSKSKTKTNTK